MSTLVLTAHGSADPRAAVTTRAVADRLQVMSPGLDVRTAFCERTAPELRSTLAELAVQRRREAVVVPFLLASAYHARVDIPRLIAESGARERGVRIRRADALGEDRALIQVLRDRLAELGTSRLDGDLGVVVVAVGSSDAAANARTARVCEALAAGTRWATATAFVTGPRPTLAESTAVLRGQGRRVVIAPWFLAHGVLTDRIARFAEQHDLPVAEPLGAHRLVAATVLDRYEAALEAGSTLRAS
ncbi:sirohydrochlorin chelatase [Mycobacterium sp. MYCO198283]|uniref:sirohydrochlorin chelatase n=1 Tax=Mycobacterium sp. MYCO198283 TaxID=2883505 RepID=UPI001E418622|nr:sirohydrochlorin chelatase [Mycobacterium sp. MYCO198283]MCG5432523.1 sirohydrochlorin chelatase [Mycobacterium sp. MYCO198283]